MAFRFTARVMRQLGAELISSDEVALYELVKNGFDAGAKHVTVDIGFFIDREGIRALEASAEDTFRKRNPSSDHCTEEIRDVLSQISADRNRVFLLSNEQIEELVSDISQCKSASSAIQRIRLINRIIISDDGCGMSKDDVESNFLVVGTTHRRKQHEAFERDGTPYPNGVPVSGEKGIGRLSAMRLGDTLQLKTAIQDSPNDVTLDVDWDWFERHPDADITKYDVRPVLIRRNRDDAASGTTITIGSLQHAWSKKDVSDLVSEKIAKFLDPFDRHGLGKRRRQKLRISWNGERVDLASAAQVYLDAAHNGMRGHIEIDDTGEFRAKVEYWFRNQSDKTARIDLNRTYTAADFGSVAEDVLSAIGPFSFELYHYNRRNLAAIPGVADRAEFKKWLDAWCGGLMLFRDGIRVLPYGQYPDDDWLHLDQRALRAKGFRVNRIQVVGCVRISRTTNPHLVDQTNREGLQNKQIALGFQQLLRDFIESYFVGLFRQYVEEQTTSPDDLLPRVGIAEDAVTTSVTALIAAAQDGDTRAIATAKRSTIDALQEIKAISGELEALISNQQLHQLEVAELAAKGLSAEYLAHDLEGVLDTSISDAGAILRNKALDSRLATSLRHLTAILKSTRTQISAIKPGPSSRRRRRSEMDVFATVDEVISLFKSRCERHQIALNISRISKVGTFSAYVVDGHLRQILENLIRNSLFWVLNTRETKRNAPEAVINIVIDARARVLTVRDSGVGFSPDEADWVFVPFNTHRKGGHGLGLALSKELGEFNKMRIFVDRREKNEWDRYTGITVDLSDSIRTTGADE
ncbi:MAG: histidine kinase [Schlesneria sp.]|nr:histidine kinase [Schlesneria sp.]